MADDYFGNVLMVILGMALMGLLFVVFGGNDTEELGQSICEEEYGMDFKSYENKQLECKPRVIDYREQYDGIVVKILEE